ncbi:YeeE/YedE thiosulfate transporter family protein [Yoonia sp.]|uniref:YeeE/YedE thiosulfate transporter family protein n=1 Tax=Yoonia sp. TaxID=2212373 RepID=UPI003975EFA8
MNTMMDVLRDPNWSPYVVGIGIGVLSWLAFLFSNHPLGISTAFAKTAGMIEKAVRGPKVAEKLYYQENKPGIDWEWMLVIGVFIGALVSAWISGTFRLEWVPPMWEAAFGANIFTRLAVAVAGGICVGFGARWGCGCTSGHGISGTMQLVLGSWLSAACFFIGGVAVAMVMYRVL